MAVSNCGLKVFLFIMMFGPMLFVTILLTLIGLIANCFTLLYFMIFGWICELEYCESEFHGPFIEEALIKPYEPLKSLCKKVGAFLCPEKKSKEKSYKNYDSD